VMRSRTAKVNDTKNSRATQTASTRSRTAMGRLMCRARPQIEQTGRRTSRAAKISTLSWTPAMTRGHCRSFSVNIRAGLQDIAIAPTR